MLTTRQFGNHALVVIFIFCTQIYWTICATIIVGGKIHVTTCGYPVTDSTVGFSPITPTNPPLKDGECNKPSDCKVNECCTVAKENDFALPGKCRSKGEYYCGRQRVHRNKIYYEELCDCSDPNEKCVFFSLSSLGCCI